MKTFKLLVLFLTNLFMVFSAAGQSRHITGESLVTGVPYNAYSPFNYLSFPVFDGQRNPSPPLQNQAGEDDEQAREQAAEEERLRQNAESADKELSNLSSDDGDSINDSELLSESFDKKTETPGNQDQSEQTAKDGWSFGMTLFGIGLFYEVGKVQNLEDKIDEIEKQLDSDEIFNINNGEEALNIVRDHAADLEEDGYGLLEVSVNPLAPLVVRLDSGQTYSLNFRLEAGARTNFIKGNNPADVTSDLGQNCVDAFLAGEGASTALLTNCVNDVNSNADLRSCLGDISTVEYNDLINCNIFTLTSDSSLEIQGYLGYNFGFGFGDHLRGFSFDNLGWLDGDLYYGIQAEYHVLDTYQVDYLFSDASSDDTVEEVIDNAKSSASLLDFEPGIQYVANRFSVNFGIEHLFSPTLKYEVSDLRLDANPYLGISAYRLFGEERKNMTFSFYQDLGESTSLNGVKNKWRVFSFAYSPPFFFIPDIRLSKRYNLIRSKLDYNQIGLSMGKFFELNLAASSETVQVSGSELPRSLIMNLSFNIPI